MHKICHNDCIDLQLKDIKLVYMDPPFAHKTEDKYYIVGNTFDEYIAYMVARLIKLKTFLATDGANILIHIDWKAVHYLKVECDKIFGRENFRNHIVWCYSSPSVASRYLPRKHDDILWYGLNDYTFNSPTVPYSGKLNVGGKSAWSDKKDTTEYLNKGKKLEGWWTDVSSLCRNENEKLSYPTQKPLKLMNRIVETFSNPGQMILDPFCGSDSFLEAAKNLGRIAIGSDISEEAVMIARKRIDQNS